jgi:hypothetical protein
MIFGKNNWLYWYLLISLCKALSHVAPRLSWWISDQTGMTDRLSNLLGYDIRVDRDKPD